MALNSSTKSANDEVLATDPNELRLDILELGGGGLPTSTGSANTQAIAMDAQLVAYATGQVIKFIAGYTNTGAVTINVNSIGAKGLKSRGGQDFSAFDIVAGQIITAIYNGTDFTADIELGHFGEGSDGTADLDGVNSYGWASYSSNEYTLLRDVFLKDLVIQSSITLKTNGYRVYGVGSLSGEGTISNSGTDASGTTAGVGGIANAIGGGTDGGVGVSVGSGAYDSGNPGGAISSSIGGAGGDGADVDSPFTDPGAGGAWTETKQYPRSKSYPDSLIETGTTIAILQGGSGGGSGSANAGAGGTGISGGGGGGGGIVFLAFKFISDTLTILATGGDGGNGGGTVNGGGGGGGGGGAVYIRCLSCSATVSVSGGTKGTNQGTITTDCEDGADGTIIYEYK